MTAAPMCTADVNLHHQDERNHGFAIPSSKQNNNVAQADRIGD
jgi:hypothetical protein